MLEGVGEVDSSHSDSKRKKKKKGKNRKERRKKGKIRLKSDILDEILDKMKMVWTEIREMRL